MDTSEEKYPLLLLYAEDNVKKFESQKKSVFNENNRGKKILQGATTIITQWPGHMTTCWITALCFGILLLFTTMLLTYSYENSKIIHIQPKCLKIVPENINNKSIHIVHEDEKWDEKQLDILQYIVNVYTNYSIHISIFHNSTKDKVTKRPCTNITKSPRNIETTTPTTTTQKTTTQKNQSSLFFYDGPLQSFDAFTFFEKLKNNWKPPPKKVPKKIIEKKTTFEEIVNKTNVKVSRYTYKEYFNNTPLKYEWKNLNSDMLQFACRVQELWQYGGISFNLPNFPNVTINGTKNGTKIIIIDKRLTDETLKNIILTSKSVFEQLPSELVSVDRKAYHMGSKIPCHSFFGRLMTKIATNKPDAIIQILVEETLRDFCKRGAVNAEDCTII